MSPVPPNWLPLVPPNPNAAAPIKLALGAVLRDGAIQKPTPRGRVMALNLSRAAEEVPREGFDVTRRYRYARWSDGWTHLWQARTRRPAEGEVSSALRFDALSTPG